MNDHLRGLAWGSFIGDALAMPVHWYYDRAALHRDYGIVRDYLAPRNPHADSILWRSTYTPLNERGDILREQAQYWGQRGIHYHQFLCAGENTLNLQLAKVLIDSLVARGHYDADDYLRRYIEFMLTPGQHRDTYVEEYHRKFFTAYARGTAPRRCAGSDIHIGGLAHVGVLCAFFAADVAAAREAVREHVRLTHRSEEVLAAGDALARMLCAVAAGADLREAIFQHGADWFSKRKAGQWSREPDEVVIGHRVSPACYIADAFPASLYLSWKYAGDFEAGVIANTNVGGDNCHRGAVVGALLGAAFGLARIPARLVEGIHHDTQRCLQCFAEFLHFPAPSGPRNCAHAWMGPTAAVETAGEIMQCMTRRARRAGAGGSTEVREERFTRHRKGGVAKDAHPPPTLKDQVSLQKRSSIEPFKQRYLYLISLPLFPWLQNLMTERSPAKMAVSFPREGLMT